MQFYSLLKKIQQNKLFNFFFFDKLKLYLYINLVHKNYVLYYCDPSKTKRIIGCLAM